MREESTATLSTIARYLDPMNDVAFKKLFGQEGHEFLLISFLNAVLGLVRGKEIQKIQLLPKNAKMTGLDVKYTDAEGNQYIVKMQNVSRGYLSQFSAGEEYVSLKPVILLCIADRVLFPQKPSNKIISYHRTLDVDTSEHDLQDISYVFIELPKFTSSEYELKTTKDKWLYFFTNWNHSSEVPLAMQEREFIEAYRTMEKFNWTPAEYEAYIKARIVITDECVARQAEREEGKAEGALEKTPQKSSHTRDC